MSNVTEGKPAPEFTLLDQHGTERELADYRGKPVVLYFYPKDNTPGCTIEACNFRDDYSAYEEAGVEILGISPDDPKSHTKFIKKFDLPFTLLADTDHEVSNKYGVWGPKKIFGREYEGVLRTTFLISPEGDIAKIYNNVKPPQHSKEILEAIKSLL
jgi:peroxiredoxin Q/BCP